MSQQNTKCPELNSNLLKTTMLKLKFFSYISNYIQLAFILLNRKFFEVKTLNKMRVQISCLDFLLFQYLSNLCGHTHRNLKDKHFCFQLQNQQADQTL